MSVQPQYFYIAAAMIIDADFRLLLVRKRNTEKFMLPGGKIDQGETALEALIRELREEIDFNVTAKDAIFIDEYEAEAANEPNYRIQSQLFSIALDRTIVISPQAEIEETIWLEPNKKHNLNFAPLIKEKIIPLWEEYLARK